MFVIQNHVIVYLEYLITQRHSKEVSYNMYLIRLICASYSIARLLRSNILQPPCSMLIHNVLIVINSLFIRLPVFSSGLETIKLRQQCIQGIKKVYNDLFLAPL